MTLSGVKGQDDAYILLLLLFDHHTCLARRVILIPQAMDHIDMNRLKTGEVNLGVSHDKKCHFLYIVIRF